MQLEFFIGELLSKATDRKGYVLVKLIWYIQCSGLTLAKMHSLPDRPNIWPS